jgi:aminoglycoside phosphotransferase (APT) family kinase protein
MGDTGLSDVIVAPATRDLEILAGKLTQWLGERLPGASGLQLANFSYPKGAGQSHETILFDAQWNEGGVDRAQGYVVRIKPSSFTVFPDNLFDEQYQLMNVLHDGGYVRVARPLWFEEDAELLGSPFFVMEKVTGRVPVSVPPYAKSGWLSEATPPQRRRLWEGAVRQLAAVQLVPLGKVQFLAGPDHAREGLAQEWDKYTRFVEWVKDDPRAEILEAGRRRLESLWPKNQPAGLVWGDARIGNMMFDENFDVVAVMDWEQPSLGGALQDLAWFCTLSEIMHGSNSPIGAPLEGMGTRAETIALWEEITGKSAADLEWYEQFTQLKMACTGVRMDGMRGTQMSTAESLRVRLKV